MVPTYIEGTFEVMPRDARLPRLHPVTIRFGAPLHTEQLAAKGDGDTKAERIADGLRSRVLALRPSDDQ